MPRNASGIYTLPAGNPVTPGDVVDAAWANSTLSDIATEITNSLSRTGAGGMIAPFRVADGSVTTPGVAFLNETNTGMYRASAGTCAVSILGVNTGTFSTVGLTIPASKALTAQGNASVGGTLAVTGAATMSSTLAVTGAITATGGVVGNVTGNVTAAAGSSSFNDVVITGSLDMTAGSSATITGLSTPTNASDAANKGYVDTQDALRLALTGGTMSGSIAMGSNSITGLAAPSASGDATNKSYVDTQDATRLPLAGGTMTGAIAMGTNKITGLGTPTADADAATKAYVDSVAQGLDVKASVKAATTANITLSGAQTIDGVSVDLGDRVLVKDQTSAAQNGIYVASGGAWTRSTDADTWAELPGAFVFVEQGTVNDNSGWVCTVAAGGTLGSTAVTFEQFSGAGQITAGAGMVKVGNTLNVQSASNTRIVVGADEIDLASTGVGAGTYKSVTVDVYGRVTAGTNPTTLSGYGITDAYTTSQTDTLLNGKLSLTGGTMSGNLAMGGFKVTGLGAPANADDAATKTYVDTADALKLNLTGGTMSGAIAMGTNKITGMGDPTNPQDAATKNYIDTIFGSTASAAASASAAATSASNAATSESNAATSASSALSSANAAAASYDSFDDRYLGAKTSDPTLDNDGNALITGALYFNSVANEMRVYTGSAWLAAYIPATGYLQLTGGTMTGPLVMNVNSSSDALKITQTGSGNALYIEDVAADATPFVVSSTGVLGIGTTTPDNVTSAGIALVSNNGYYPQLIQRNTTNDANASYIGLEKNRNGGVVQNGDILGNVVFRGYDGAQYLQGAAVWAQVSAAPGTNDMPTDFVIGTTPDGAAGITERVRVTAAGNTGIGTASPTERLDVAGTVKATTFSGSGASLTNLNASNLSTGTVATARLASGTANSSTFLRGDQTWAAVTSLPGAQGQVFTSNGTFTIPTGITAIKVTVVGGGGGGGNATYVCAHGSGGGGGGGGTAIKYLTSLTPGNTLSVTVGGGGGATATGGTSSVSSGTQAITTISGTGGGGGTSGTGGAGSGGSGGSSSGGDMNSGGGGGDSGQVSRAVQGGASMFGGGGRASTNTTTGEAGRAYGGGGSGGCSIGSTNGTGGAGAAGVVIFEW